MRQFAVLGLGTYGYYIATTLAKLGGEVLVIDSNENAIQRIKDKVTQAVVADVTDRVALEKLGVGSVDCALVNLGSRIDYSILTTLHLQEMGIKEIVVKAISDEHVRILKKIGATRIVYPEKEAGINIGNSLINPNVLDYIPLSDGYSIVEVTPKDSLVGVSLAESNIRHDYNLNVLAITVLRSGEDERKMITPLPSYQIKADDQLLIMGKDDDIARFEGSLSGPTTITSRVLP